LDLTIAISFDNADELQVRPGTPVTRRLTQVFRYVSGALQAIALIDHVLQFTAPARNCHIVSLARVDTRTFNARPTSFRTPTRAEPRYAHAQALRAQLHIAHRQDPDLATATGASHAGDVTGLPLPLHLYGP
jgi:hypothetical protein